MATKIRYSANRAVEVEAGRPVRGCLKRPSRELTRELLENDPELTCDPIFHDVIVEDVLRRRTELSRMFRGEITAVLDTRRRWFRPWTVAALAALLFTVTLPVWTIFLECRNSLSVKTSRSRTRAVPGEPRRHSRSSRDGASTGGVLARPKTPYGVAAAIARPDPFPDRRVAERGGRWSNTLQTTKAPALVGLNLQDTVPSATYKRLRAFIDGHEASAIGLAGPRGSGKTTLMGQLERDDSLDCHVAVVSAPVHYSATDFTRLVHRRLADTVLKPGEANLLRDRMAAPTLRATVPIARAILATAVLLLLLALWIYEKDRPRPKSFDLGRPEMTALAAGLLILGFVLSKAWGLFQRRTKLMSPARTARELCLQQLEFLRWSATLEASATTALKVAGSGFDGLNRLSRTERELTHAEAVRALKEFIEQLVDRGEKSVIICVDELDKLADPHDAIEAINGMKDLFRIPHGHFVLSVSTDAMHSFAARGVPVRDVFDSAFDTIIPVGQLTIDESRTLIARRARDFSAAAVMFCHAWSGGHARDLIRTSRSCVESRHALRDGEEPTVAGLARRVLHSDLSEVVDATIAKLCGEDDALAAAMLYHVLAFQEAIEAGGTTLHEVVEASTFPGRVRAASSEAQRLAAALEPYARIAGLCEHLFSIPRDPGGWQSEPVREAVTALADARWSLGSHPQEIDRRLKRAVDACAAAGPARPGGP